MENQTAVPVVVQKQPRFDGKVSGLGFIVLAVLMVVLPQFLIIIFPSAMVIEGSLVLVALIVGFVVGLKSKYKPFVSGFATGVMGVVFAEFALVPSPSVGLLSAFRYSIVILLPVLIGTLVGRAMNKTKITL